jgi:hypothetical protein
MCNLKFECLVKALIFPPGQWLFADEVVDLGPEDGEDPLNYDMDVMATEGYGLL